MQRIKQSGVESQDEKTFNFRPRRVAILLIGGDKTGDKRFYEKYIPIIDQLYDDYLKEIREEGLI